MGWRNLSSSSHCANDPTAPPLPTMNIFSHGLACEDDSEGHEKTLVPYTDENISNGSEETEQRRNNSVMDIKRQQHNEELDFEIWPVEHPMEPPDEDRPVKCPVPESSVINDEGKREKRLAESLRKRAEEYSAAKKEGKTEESSATAIVERPVRTVRKRHHMTLITGGDNDEDDNNNNNNNDNNNIMPLSRMPPLPTKNLTIFQVLQQFDKFES